jgi:hypothetical protein
MRDTFREMGHLSARGLFVHLYLNGLYWGAYNLCERPSAPFLAEYLGGSEEDYDSRNGQNILSGDNVAWEKMMAIANGGLAGENEYRAIQQYLSLTNLADYMIVNLYGGNSDWDRVSNWYAGRKRNGGQFIFLVWDGERTLEAVDTNTIDYDDDQSPTRLFQKLRANPQFRALFAERAAKHLTGNGALSPGLCAARFQRHAQELDLAMIAESARWGSYRRDFHQYKTGPYESYTRDDHWRPEVQRLATKYFPVRTAEVLRQFRRAGLAAGLE